MNTLLLPRPWILRSVIALSLALSACSRTEKAQFRTQTVRRGTIVASISATGTLQPEEVIDVGAQVAGRIRAFGNDRNGKPIDFGSAVEQGDVLAHIDDALYAAEAAQAEARLEAARAGVLKAEADLQQLRAKLEQAERDWSRAQKLGSGSALSPSLFDQYRANYQMAVAAIAVGAANIAQTKATAAQAEAELRHARQQLDYCVIRSPVKGVIIDRRVNIGQTVVSSLNAPSLFLIAEDLQHMVVWVSVNEADVGSIATGQAAMFSVDAYPAEVFRGTVRKIRLNAAMTQNVVTYIVEVETENRDGKLLPYLTASVRFELGRKDDALSVPNAALRFAPSEDERGVGAAVWLLEGGKPRRVAVERGLSDGIRTEVTGELREGQEVIVGVAESEESPPTQRAPFAPPLQGERRSR